MVAYIAPALTPTVGPPHLNSPNDTNATGTVRQSHIPRLLSRPRHLRHPRLQRPLHQHLQPNYQSGPTWELPVLRQTNLRPRRHPARDRPNRRADPCILALPHHPLRKRRPRLPSLLRAENPAAIPPERAPGPARRLGSASSGLCGASIAAGR
jgi:hypothetical protein